MRQEKIVIGRHPVYDENHGEIAYKLLFRSKAQDGNADIMDGSHATAKVLVNALINFGLDKVASGRKVYVSMTREFLLGKFLSLLPPSTIVLELPADDVPDEEMILACQEWRSRGFQIAFRLNEKSAPHMEAILANVDVVEVDAQALSEPGLVRKIDLLRQHSIKLLAQRIETSDELARAKSLGFDYFQGFFFCEPEKLEGSVVSVSKISLLSVLQATYASENIEEIETHITHDISLSYQLLRYINSVGFDSSRKIHSIDQALGMLGLKGIRNWMVLMMYASVDTDTPTEVVARSLLRGRILENLVAARGNPRRKLDCFLLGMFSLLDQILNMPMEEAVASLALPNDIRDGLLNPDSKGGRLIDLVKTIETGDWGEMDHDCEEIGVDSNLVMKVYSDASYWVDKQISLLASVQANPQVPILPDTDSK